MNNTRKFLSASVLAMGAVGAMAAPAMAQSEDAANSERGLLSVAKSGSGDIVDVDHVLSTGNAPLVDARCAAQWTNGPSVLAAFSPASENTGTGSCTATN